MLLIIEITSSVIATYSRLRLLPRRPGPRKAHKLTDEVMEFVGQLRAEEPVLSAEELAGRIEGRFGLSVHPRSIERAQVRREKKQLGYLGSR